MHLNFKQREIDQITLLHHFGRDICMAMQYDYNSGVISKCFDTSNTYLFQFYTTKIDMQR